MRQEISPLRPPPASSIAGVKDRPMPEYQLVLYQRKRGDSGVLSSSMFKQSADIAPEIIRRILIYCDRRTHLQCRSVSSEFCHIASSFVFASPKLKTVSGLRKLHLITQSGEMGSYNIRQHLRHLDFSKRSDLVSMEHLSSILASTNLRSLNLANSRISALQVKIVLGHIRGLRHLNLDNCDISDDVLNDAVFDGLWSLSLIECRNISNQVFVSLARFPQLAILSLSFAKRITGSGFRVAYLDKYRKVACPLQQLSIESCGRWEDIDLRTIADICGNLKTLRLVSNSGTISAGSIEYLMDKLSHCLRQLDISLPRRQTESGIIDTAPILTPMEAAKVRQRFPTITLNVT